MPFAEIEAALAQTGEWTGDLWQRTRDGRALVVRVRKLLRRRASELARVLEVLSDVTAQRATEARLRASEARFRAAVEAVNGILWTTNAAGEMEGEQTGWAALTGQSQKEYEGRGWLEAVHPDDAQTTLDAWHKAVEERKPFVFEHRLCRRNGGWRRYAIHAIPLLRDDNTVYEWVGVHTDVTEQREAEAVLTRDRDELERLVSERTRDLEQTRERLVHAQRMEALGRLAGGIAHDFNNVLQAVEGGASLIERRPADLDNVRRRVRMIMDAAGRGAAITRRLLAFARRDDLRAEPVDVAPLLDGVCEILAHTLDPAIEIRTETPPGLPPLIADRGQLETVLINLAMNSRDAMPNGGVITLAARTEVLHNRKSRMAQSIPANLQPGRYLRLLVADTGAGMAPEVLSRASEPFFTTKGQGEGTGLGLAMAKGFAEQSGGALHIESTPGHGAIITLWFPAAAPTIVSSLTSTARKTHAAVRRHVLLVDDDALVREITADQLKMEGYSVRSAESGPEALALLDTGEAVDLLISDLAMPGMNGIAVISEAQKRRSRLPAILLTGFAGDTTELAISEKLRNTILVRKPVIGPQLVEQAEMLLTS